MKSNKRT